MSASLPSTVNQPDEYVEWISRIVSGDADAERLLVERFLPGVRALVRRHARPGDPIVEDLTQDIFSHLIPRLRAGALHDPAALPGYIRSTVVLTVQAEYRRRGRRGQNQASVDPDTLTSSDDPSIAVDREHLQQRLHVLIEALPTERDRELLRRFYLNEQDRNEVCAALDVSHDHFHRVLHRARQRLKTLLGGSDLGDLQ